MRILCRMAYRLNGIENMKGGLMRSRKPPIGQPSFRPSFQPTP